MGASDAFERELLNLRFGSGTPTNWFVGLSRADPNDDGTGFNEPTGIGSYARVQVVNNVTNFPAATTSAGRTTQKNGTAITWVNPTASWGSIVAVGFFTTLTGGLPLYTQKLDDPITVSAGNTPVEFAANEIEIEAD